MKVASLTDPGLVRSSNEDSLFADRWLGLLIVADGMGGHKGGEVASRIAVDTISRLIRTGLAGGDGADPDDLIRNAIQQADVRIRRESEADAELEGMGTTLVLALCRGDAIHLAHAGDSRAYLVHDGALRQLTEDHSLVAQMLKAGQLTANEAPHFRLRNIVTRSLGNKVPSEAELATVEWSAGDYLLLCSDRLTNMLDDSELESVIAGGGENVEGICRDAIERANLKGGKDNITAVLAYHE
jgi:serine/threonine protein phosphatase PrpC